jgi:hypothetical protein
MPSELVMRHLGLDAAALAHRVGGDVAERAVATGRVVAARDVGGREGEEGGEVDLRVELGDVVEQQLGGVFVFFGFALLDARLHFAGRR